MSDSKASTSAKIVDKWRRRSVADDVSTCWVCGSDLTDPRTLPCLHSFCSECLLVLLQTYESKGKLDRIFRCPQCKTLVPNYIPEKVSPTWLRMFPTKRSIDNMKDAVNLIEEMCKPCSEKWKIVPATKFCVDCQNFICLQCEADHKSVKENTRHKIMNYELKELRATPASNVSKFNCPQHKNLRCSTFCESHGQFLCNTCMESGQHMGCRLKNNIIETVRSITKSEAKLHVINHLKHDERNLGKDHVRVIERIDNIQKQLEELKARHTTLYCNYVMQATVTDHKTGAMDALKGKLEFDKHHRNPEPVIKTMTKVETILSEFTSVFADVVDDKIIRHDVHKSINEIQKILNRELHGGRNDVTRKTFGDEVTKEENLKVGIEVAGVHHSHRCKRHTTVAMPGNDIQMMSKAMVSVGMISYTGMTGTAFRVGTKYVMTAAHIVRDIVDPERTKDSDWQALDDRNVFITFSESTNDENRFWFVPQIPFLNDDLGVAVLEIKEPVGLPPPLSVGTKDVPDTELTEVMTVGYRLCGTLKMFVESGCDVIMKDSERAFEAMEWLRVQERKYRCSLILDGEDHTVLNWKYDNFKHNSKLTLDMSADYRALGSPVLIKSGKYGLKVISILTDSVPECLTDMPTTLQERFPQEHRFESGTRMSCIYDVMAIESRLLADDLFLVDERL